MSKRETRSPSRRRLRRPPSRRQSPPRLEQLEDRTLLSVTVLENFESDLSNYKTVLHYYPAADLAAAAAHDGLQGLDKHDGYEWMIRNDPGSQVSEGERFSVWVQFAGTADGRAYFGFGATPAGPTQDSSANRIPSLVLAANTNQLMFQNFSGLNFSNLGTPVNQTYQPDRWYRVEVTWAVGGALTGKLYDSDGVTLLNTVTGNFNTVTSGFVAFRGFQSDKYFDTVVVDSDSTASPQDMVDAGGGLDPNWMYQDPPPPPMNGPSDGPTPIPWDYTSVPGTGRKIQLQAFNSLQQFANSGGWVALAATNVSYNAGTVGVDWGPDFASGNGGAPATPMLAQYLFRQLPGDNTYLIGKPAALKHFFAPPILNPGQSDAYGSGTNANQNSMTPGSEVDPVTGVLHRPSFTGPMNVNGFDVHTNRSFGPLDLRLAVPIADLDPAQNPPGTKWYLMGNIYVEGDEDVTTTSHWVEITPSWNGSTFSFSYPQGAGGQFNFRTIPGLVETGAPPRITNHTPSGLTNPPVNRVEVRFSHQMDPSSFDPSKIQSFVGPNGPITVTAVTPADGTNTLFDISFASQTSVGNYTMVIGPDIQDTDGVSMTAPYTATFTISSDLILNGGFETGDFTGWTRSGNLGATGVDRSRPHSGDYAAYLGPNGSEGYLAQTFATTPGATYVLDYWLQHDGGSPCSFHAMINGVDIHGSVILNEPDAFDYKEFTFPFTATGTSTELKFGFREDPRYFHLDDVTVSPGASPGPSGAAFFVRQGPTVVSRAGLVLESQGQRALSRPLEELVVLHDLDRYFGSSLATESGLSPAPLYPEPRWAGVVGNYVHDFDLEGKWL